MWTYTVLEIYAPNLRDVSDGEEAQWPAAFPSRSCCDGKLAIGSFVSGTG